MILLKMSTKLNVCFVRSHQRQGVKIKAYVRECKYYYLFGKRVYKNMEKKQDEMLHNNIIDSLYAQLLKGVKHGK